jgi:hypothetical protein
MLTVMIQIRYLLMWLIRSDLQILRSANLRAIYSELVTPLLQARIPLIAHPRNPPSIKKQDFLGNHFGGIDGQRMIIAVNKDPLAPIFSAAHYDLLDDILQFIAEFRKQMK